jgi:hypothetical protein
MTSEPEIERIRLENAGKPAKDVNQGVLVQ